MSGRVVICGAAGRMGRALIRCIRSGAVDGLELSGAVEFPGHELIGDDAGDIANAGTAGILLTDDLRAELEQGDVMIDFSFHSASPLATAAAAESGRPAVIGTTGLTPEECDRIAKAAQAIPIVQAPNMSLGINLLMSLVKTASAALKGKGYDIEITEQHHRRKKDAPSGTALGLGRSAAEGMGRDLEELAIHGRSGIAEEERSDEEIGFHAIRGGGIFGDHTVLFAGEGECIELSHRLLSRDTLALGALQAAAWVADKKPGLYSMQDVLGLHAN